MQYSKNILWFLMVTWFLAGSPIIAQAEGGGAAAKAIQAAAKSPAGKKFAEIVITYLIGKGFDEIYAYSTAPDPAKLNETLTKMQTENPDYKFVLGTLRRAVSHKTTRDEFELLAREMVMELDRAQLSKTPMITPALQINPATSPLTLTDYGLGVPRLDTSNLRARLNAPLGKGLYNLAPSITSALDAEKKDESLLAAKLVGAWSFSSYDNGLSRSGDVFIFHRNGKLTLYQVIEDGIYSFTGKYSLSGKRLSIHWAGADGVLTANVEEIDGWHLKYTADQGVLDLAAPPAQTLKRISDFGDYSVVTIKNPTQATARFFARWATMQGSWSSWETLDLKPNETRATTYQGGFFCQISFNPNEEGVTERRYEVPFNVVTSLDDPNLLKDGTYVVTQDGAKIGLARDTQATGR